MDNIQKTYHCAEVLGWVSKPEYSEYETGERALLHSRIRLLRNRNAYLKD
jgi:hypothetical protein